MNQHFAIVGGQAVGQRLLVTRDHAGNWSVLGSGNASLSSLVASALERLRSDANADFTFDTRSATEAIPPIEKAEDLQGWAPGAEIIVLAPERSEGDGTLWNRAWRCPQTGGVTCDGKLTRYRVVLLADEINKWFAQADYRSFDPPSPWTAARELQFPVTRPPHHRMLLVRHGHDWRIRDLAPSAFESRDQEAARLAALAKTESEFEARRKAKDPMEKTRLMQAQYARDRELLGVSAEERARRELERKASFGREIREPTA